MLPPNEIKDYIGSLMSTAEPWYITFNPLDGGLPNDEWQWLDRLNRIGIAYFRPLVAISFISHGVTSADRVALFREIERFIFIAFRLGRAFSTFRNSAIYKVTRQLKNQEINTSEIIKL